MDYKDFLWARLASLQNGEFTDCTILIGPENGKMHQVHAIKGLVVSSSHVLKNLFDRADRTEFQKPTIRINDVDVKIFQLLIEFLHLSQLVSFVDLEDLADLAIAAHKFEVLPLQKHCCALIENQVSPKTVWPLLDKLMKNSLLEIADACSKVISNETLRCLEQPSFLTASEESVIFLLNQDELKVQSEKSLISYCAKWANNQKLKRTALRRLLPYIRLLTLTPQETLKLSAILTDKEKVALYEHKLGNCDGKLLPDTLCPLTNPRLFQLKFEESRIHNAVVQKLVPDDLIIADGGSVTSEMRFRTEQMVTNIFHFVPAVDLHLIGFNLLGQIADRPSIKKLNLETASSSVYVDLPQSTTYKSKFSVSVVKPVRCEQLIEGEHSFNEPDAYFEFKNPILIPRGSKVHINFNLYPTQDNAIRVYRSISQTPVMDWLSKEFAGNDVFESIALQSGLNSPIVLRSITFVPRN